MLDVKVFDTSVNSQKFDTLLKIFKDCIAAHRLRTTGIDYYKIIIRFRIFLNTNWFV